MDQTPPSTPNGQKWVMTCAPKGKLGYCNQKDKWHTKPIDNKTSTVGISKKKYYQSPRGCSQNAWQAQSKFIITTGKKLIKNPFSTAGGSTLCCHMDT